MDITKTPPPAVGGVATHTGEKSFIGDVPSSKPDTAKPTTTPPPLSSEDRAAVDEVIRSVREQVAGGKSNETSNGEKKAGETSSSLSYWEEAVGPEHAAEAMRVCDGMLNDDAAILRIVVARRGDVEKATDLFLEQVRWRARWRPQMIKPEWIPNALPSGAWRLCGHSREGCVVSNYKLRHWNHGDYGTVGSNDDAVREYVHYVAYMLELMIASMPPHPTPPQFVVIFDLDGFSPSLVFNSNVRSMIRNLIYIAQAQYPERLRKVLLVNAPFGFGTAWTLISGLLDEKTASKVHFVGVKDLSKDVETSVLSKEYGGTHGEYPIPKGTLQEEVQRCRESKGSQN